jgi:hypothetical protein
MEKHYAIGDEGPAGGRIVLIAGDSECNWRYAEAAPCCIAKVSWDEAVRLCAEYRQGGYDDWELADLDCLITLIRSNWHGDCTDYYAPGWHWTNVKGKAFSFWGPATAWSNTRGQYESLDTATPCAVRPVRKFL